METHKEFAYKPAGIGVRFVALIIDGMILGLLTGIFVYLPVILLAMFTLFFTNSQEQDSVLGSAYLICTPLSYAAYAVYYGYFYSRRGATPGKAIMRLKVLHSDVGCFPSFWQAAGREIIGKTLNAFVCGLGYLMPLFRSDKRALHDLVFSTRVVRRID